MNLKQFTKYLKDLNQKDEIKCPLCTKKIIDRQYNETICWTDQGIYHYQISSTYESYHFRVKNLKIIVEVTNDLHDETCYINMFQSSKKPINFTEPETQKIFDKVFFPPSERDRIESLITFV